MGFFSDIIKMAASEVANAVIDGINEAVSAQEEQTAYLEELKEKYADVSYSTLVTLSEYDKCDENELAAINSVMQDRADLVNELNNSPENFCEFDDEALVDYYDNLISNRGCMFSDTDAETIIRLFKDEVMSRHSAKKIYLLRKLDCFDETSYEKIETVASGTDIFSDDILKAEAEKTLSYRNSLIESVEPDAVDDLDNDELMKIYALARADVNELLYDYFGRHRQKVLRLCERELFTNRKYLIKKFISDYCEDEIEMYSNYSEKKLKSIVSASDNSNLISIDGTQYNLCDILIAQLILDERGGE